MKREALRGFVFFTQDYFGDTAVRMMPHDIRIVWVEAFLLMDQSPRRGILLKKNGETYSVKDLACLMNCPIEIVERGLQYAVDQGIASIDGWTRTLMSRRMVREEKRREINSKNGRKGGNPNLKIGRVRGDLGNLKAKSSEPASHLKNLRDSVNRKPTSGAKQKRTENQERIDREFVENSKLATPASLWDNNAPAGSVNRNANRPVKAKPDPEPDPELGNKEGKGKGDGPGLKNAGTRPRDLASDLFAAKSMEFTGSPYVPEVGDFVMLAKLRKAFGTPARDMPPGWESAVEHYFGSPLPQYSLTDLANPKRYAVFKNSALDEFNKPINHHGNGNGRKTKADRNREAAQSLLSRLDSQDSEREQRGDHGSDASGVPGAPVAVKSGSDR